MHHTCVPMLSVWYTMTTEGQVYEGALRRLSPFAPSPPSGRRPCKSRNGKEAPIKPGSNRQPFPLAQIVSPFTDVIYRPLSQAGQKTKNESETNQKPFLPFYTGSLRRYQANDAAGSTTVYGFDLIQAGQVTNPKQSE